MSVVYVAWDGPEPGSKAMARDRTLVETVLAPDHYDGLLRFHGWSRACLSFGRGQSLERGPRGELARAGVDVVRRPTGGGWLLHLPGDLAVSWIAAGPLGSGDLRAAARLVAAGIAAGLQEAGVAARTSRGEARRSRSEVCFSRVDREEVVAGEDKVAGVALARIRRAALVQAAIPLVAAPVGLAEVEAEWDPRRPEAVAKTGAVDPLALRRAVRASIAGSDAVRWFWTTAALGEAVTREREDSAARPEEGRTS